MSLELKVPPAGESISTVVISEWLIEPGQWVEADQTVVILETDKINVEVPAPETAQLAKILKQPGESAEIGEVIAVLEPGEVPAGQASKKSSTDETSSAAPPAKIEAADKVVSPAAKRLAAQSGVDAGGVTGSGKGGVVLKEDVARAAKARTSASAPAASGGGEEVVPMSPLRKKIAQRLVEAQQTAAILTTFNEVDMTEVMALRSRYKQTFLDAHGVKLGFMSFFIKAAVEALKAYPGVNAEVRGDSIVYKDFYDIGVAVGGGKGLVVPVIRGADRMSFADIEAEIRSLAVKARDMKLTMADLQGGTFTISNGGVYGSMLSTPILNPPQSGILGLHNIVERPMAVDGKVEIRPVMYLALSYDHRVVDGREAVSFLVKIKDCIENPARILLEV